MDSWENYIGSISRQNKNNSKLSKNKNIDHRVKKTRAIMSTPITYEIDCIFGLCHSKMSDALIFLL